MQGTNQQARHDLVADAQVQAAVKNPVGQANGRGLGNQIAGKQRQLHPRLALGNAIAHGRHPGGELRRGPHLGQCHFQLIGIILVRRMGREQVVVAGDDGDMRRAALLDDQARRIRLGRQGMGQVRATQALARLVLGSLPHARQVALPMGRRALLQRGGNLLDNDMQHDNSPFRLMQRPV